MKHFVASLTCLILLAVVSQVVAAGSGVAYEGKHHSLDWDSQEFVIARFNLQWTGRIHLEDQTAILLEDNFSFEDMFVSFSPDEEVHQIIITEEDATPYFSGGSIAGFFYDAYVHMKLATMPPSPGGYLTPGVYRFDEVPDPDYFNHRFKLGGSIRLTQYVHVNVPEPDTSWQHDPLTAGDWDTTSNWTGNTPSSVSFASIDNAGTAVISSGTAGAFGLTVGESNSGNLLQTGGTLTVAFKLSLGANAGSDGTYTIEGGTLNAATVEVGVEGSGTLNIAEPNPLITLSDTLLLGAGSTFSAVEGSAIHFTGNEFDIESTTPELLADLLNLTLIFEGGPDHLATLEVAGKDLGATMAGYDDNFALGTLQIGGSDVGRLQLVDLFDNQPDWEGVETIYVETLIVGSGSECNLGSAVGLNVGTIILEPGSYLDLNGLDLYYQNAIIDPSADIDYNGGELIQVPEPTTITLLLCGLASLALLRRRR